MSLLSRTKGSAYERFIANLLKPLYPDAKRGLGQARAANEVPDVNGTPWWLELKHQKCPSLFAALEQAMEATDGRPPLVVARRNGGKDVAVLRLDDLLGVLRELEELRAATRATSALLSAGSAQ